MGTEEEEDLGIVEGGKVRVIKTHRIKFPKNQSKQQGREEHEGYLKIKSNHLAGLFFKTRVF